MRGNSASGSIRYRGRQAVIQTTRGRSDFRRGAIDPYQVLHNGGAWYVYAWCETAGGWRRFRAERFLEMRESSERFVPRDDFRPFERLEELFSGEEAVPARVVFSPRIGRWLRERYPGGRDVAEGGYEVTFRVADPGWFVREILQYGAEAEVVEPESLRQVVKGLVYTHRGSRRLRSSL